MVYGINPEDRFISTFIVASNNAALIFSEKVDQFRTLRFIWNLLSYGSLVIFVLSLPHKMIGVELISSCQIVYLTLCFEEQPTFLFGSLRELNLVTGYWSLFYQEDHDKYLIPGFTDRV